MTRWLGAAGLWAGALFALGCSSEVAGSGESLGTAAQALTQSVPYRVQAESYTAFSDSDTLHEGNCGSGPVDAETTSDPNGGGCDIGWTKAGEWLEYPISVTAATKLNFVARVASANAGKTLRLLVDGQDVSGLVTAPNQGWQAFADRTVKDVSVSAGTHTLRVVFVSGDTNLNYIDVVPGTVTLPARIEAESYQRANESTPGSNSGGACDRGDGVDKENTGDTAGGGCNVGWTTPGEWLEYDVNAPQAGSYDIVARVGSGLTGRTVHVSVDGTEVGVLSVPSLGWTKFEDRTLSNISLSAGPHTIRTTFAEGETNLNYLDVTQKLAASTKGGYSFGAAAGFNLFLTEDLSQTPTIVGPIAVGRDIFAQAFGYNTSSAGSVGVVVGRTFNGSNGSVHRDVVYGTSAPLSNVGVLEGTTRQGTPINFGNEQANLKQLEANLAALSSNGTTTISADGTTIDFVGTNKTSNVFAVAGSALAATDNLRFNVPVSSTVVVNVSGSSATFETTGMQLGNVTPGRLVWNFPQATTLRISLSGFQGTLLAVTAAVSQNGSTLTGVMIAKSLVGGDNGLDWKPFNGTLPLGVCFEMGDTDKDGTYDCDDACPKDPLKTSPGFCGCGNLETDQDHDGLPKCVEGNACDNDPAHDRAGYCGCAGDYAAAGTSCVNPFCNTRGTCDGQGNCGSTDSCSPDPGHCKPRLDGTGVYWVCDGNGGANTWDIARAKCEALPGRTLIAVDSAEENLLVSTLVDSGNVWVGGTQAANGSWGWLGGKPFYDPNAADKRLNRSYLNFAPFEPATTTGPGCLALDATTGQWREADCSQKFVYVCEQHEDPPAIVPPTVTCQDFGLDANCDQPDPNCKASASTFVDVNGKALNEAQTYDQVQKCRDLCPTGNEGAPCATYCVGAMAIPPANSVCAGFSPDQHDACELDQVDESRECASDLDCTSGWICARMYDCAACDNVSGTNSTCSTTGCVARMRCGKPKVNTGNGGDCARDTGFPTRCDTVPVCVAPSQVYDTNPFTTPGTNLDQSNVPTSIFGTPDNAVTGTYPADPYCQGAACGTVQGVNHPWCRYNLTESLSDKAAGDDNIGDKKATAGQGSLISFDADPNLNLDFHVGPKPLGELELNLEAAATFDARAHFDLAITRGTVDIVNAKAGMHADRCGAKSEVYLKVFGKDLLEFLVDDPSSLNFSVPSDDTQKQCNDFVNGLTEKVDRAKKALRDAQELLRQYNEAKAAGKAMDVSQLCDVLPNPLPADFPFLGDCKSASAERIINSFIEYYFRQIRGYFSGDIKVDGGLSGHMASLSNFQVKKTQDILGPNQEDLWKVAEAQFFVGPVPMTMQVEAFVNYALNGRLEVGVTPSLPTNGNPTEIAYAYISGQPTVSTGVSLFVGVGFSAGPFEASAGVSGKVTLGEITLDAHGRAAIKASALEDKRPLPAGSETVMFPPGGASRYQLELGYDYGAKLVIPKIMKGSLSASVRVRFLFFSKRWNAEIVHFNGFPTGSEPFFEKQLFAGSGTLGKVDWGAIEMPMPFVLLTRLDETAPFASATKQAFSKDRVEELTYDSECVCIARGKSCGGAIPGDCCPGSVCDGTGKCVVVK